MIKLILFFNTLRFLKLQQILNRVLRIFIKPKIRDIYNGNNPERSINWNHTTLYEDSINNQLEACFLNFSKKLDLPADWNNKNPSKLWVYNLHYFEDLLSKNTQKKTELHTKLLNCWIDENPIGYGVGWEPYPTSLRIVNILKAWLGGLELDEKHFSSVFAQASYLSNDLEKHLLGNHYFVNLKALLFAGTIFENNRWLVIAENGLLVEIPEQILKDGANFELSPMYHSLILVDMLDILNLSRAFPSRISSQLSSMVEEYIPKMLAFMETMAHPDGGVSFFNDSVGGIAPAKIKIETYAKELGYTINPIDSKKHQIIDNFSSGYICSTIDNNKLIFDASAIGPDYIPGHAHADTLSFELSIGKQRVFVNSGTSEYGLSSLRHNQRKTRSHNTVEVNGKDSSQVWSSFRVANRAKIVSRNVELNQDNCIVLNASHNGYKSMFGGCIHSRKLTLCKDSLSLSDKLQGIFKYAISRFYFHPDLIVNLENNLLSVAGPKFFLHCDLSGLSASLINSSWYYEFGAEKPNKMLELQFDKPKLDVVFTWSKE